MKAQTNIFTKEHYDSKKILNRSEKTLPQTVVDSIENNGITLEMLDSLGVPVFRYKTQITIHGQFPRFDYARTGDHGYKNVFQNKNNSVGVHWTAIDTEKKQKIYNYLYQFDWSIAHNSTQYFAYKQKHFHTIEELVAEKKQILEEVAHIDTSLFYGNVHVFYYPEIWGGLYTAQTILNIGGIYEANVVKCIENILKMPMDRVEAILEEKRKIKEAQARKMELERQKERAEQAVLIDKQCQILIAAGLIKKNKMEIRNDLIVVNPRIYYDGPGFEYILFTRQLRQQKFRTKTIRTNEYIDHSALDFSGYSSFIYDKSTVSGWVFNTKIPEKPKETIDTTKVEGLTISKYTDKSFILKGNTKPYAAELKALKGFWLWKQGGWCFPNYMKEEIMNKYKAIEIN